MEVLTIHAVCTCAKGSLSIEKNKEGSAAIICNKAQISILASRNAVQESWASSTTKKKATVNKSPRKVKGQSL